MHLCTWENTHKRFLADDNLPRFWSLLSWVGRWIHDKSKFGDDALAWADNATNWWSRSHLGSPFDCEPLKAADRDWAKCRETIQCELEDWNPKPCKRWNIHDYKWTVAKDLEFPRLAEELPKEKTQFASITLATGCLVTFCNFPSVFCPTFFLFLCDLLAFPRNIFPSEREFFTYFKHWKNAKSTCYS